MVGIGYSTGRPRVIDTSALVGSAGNGSLGGTDRQLCDESAVHTERRMNIEASKRCNWMLGPEERVGSDSDAVDALELSAAALPIGPRRPTALREDEPQLGLGNARGKRIAQDKQRSAISASFLDVLTE